MSQYYEPPQWPPAGQTGWEHQTPPPARSGMIFLLDRPRFLLMRLPPKLMLHALSGASSVIPREESAAFTYQFEGMCRFLVRIGVGKGSEPQHPMRTTRSSFRADDGDIQRSIALSTTSSRAARCLERPEADVSRFPSLALPERPQTFVSLGIWPGRLLRALTTDLSVLRRSHVCRPRFSIPLGHRLRRCARHAHGIEPPELLRHPAAPVFARLQRGGADDAGQEENGSSAGA